MIEDGVTALGFPAGDETVLAECIRELFEDAPRAEQLGSQARITALKRHDPALVARRMMDIYQTAINTRQAGR